MAETAPRGRVAAVLAFFTLAAAVLRFWGLDRQSLWVDESFSVAWAGIFEGMTWERFFLNLQGPFHAVVLYAWSQVFGPGLAALRSLQALVATATVPLLYWALGPMRDRSSRLWAPALLAVSPFHIWYSQEVRNYAFLVFLAVLSTGFLLRLSGAPAPRRPWSLHAGYVAANVLGLLSNLSHAFTLVAHAVGRAVAGRAGRPRWRILLAGWALALALLTPWAVQFWERRVEPSGALRAGPIAAEERLRGETTAPALGVPYAYYAFSVGFTYGPSLRELHALNRRDAGSILRPHAPWILLAAAAFGVAGLWGAVRLWRAGPAGRAWLALALVPVLCTFAVASRNLKVFNPRYAAAALPAYVVLLAEGVTAPRRRAGRLALAAAILVPTGASLAQMHTDPRYWKEDARGVQALLREEARPGDLLFLVGTDLPFAQYYWRLPDGELPGVRVEDAWYWVDLSPEEKVERFEEARAAGGRAYVVFLREKEVDPSGFWAAYFDRTAPDARVVRLAGTEIRVLGEPRPAADEAAVPAAGASGAAVPSGARSTGS